MTFSLSNCQSVLSSMRFDFKSGHSINGTSILFCRIFKLSKAFLSSFALLNPNNTFTAIFAILAKCATFAMQLNVVIFREKIRPVEVLLSYLVLCCRLFCEIN